LKKNNKSAPANWRTTNDTALAVSFVVLFFISFFEGVMGMRTIQTQLVEKGLKQSNTQEIERESFELKNKKKETLSRREIEELMGTNRPTYRRVGGAFRNKR
jgi:hypothetical protein